ncbi:MAG TPA: hypothetical protein VMA09_17685 [Candidatus Binataceae bacterium]|nr:hypothetical protein [Candidatus Binataceae bacterium]
MTGTLRKLAIGAAVGTTILAGAISGCSSLNQSHIDCNVVRLQTDAGRSDDEIASAIGASVSDVKACHGSETSGNKTSGGVQSGNY